MKEFLKRSDTTQMTKPPPPKRSRTIKDRFGVLPRRNKAINAPAAIASNQVTVLHQKETNPAPFFSIKIRVRFANMMRLIQTPLRRLTPIREITKGQAR